MKITMKHKDSVFAIESTCYDQSSDSFNFLISTGDVFAMVDKLKSLNIDCEISTSGFFPEVNSSTVEEPKFELEFESKNVTESKEIDLVGVGTIKCVETQENTPFLSVELIDGKVSINESVYSVNNIETQKLYFTHKSESGIEQKIQCILKEDRDNINVLSLPSELFKIIK